MLSQMQAAFLPAQQSLVPDSPLAASRLTYHSSYAVVVAASSHQSACSSLRLTMRVILMSVPTSDRQPTMLVEL